MPEIISDPGVADRLRPAGLPFRRPQLRLGVSGADEERAHAVPCGIENALDLPQASTLCGECHVVCPVKIPLPDLRRKLREKRVERHLRPVSERSGLTACSFVAKRPALYRLATKIGVRFMRLLAGDKKTISTLPCASGWTDYREMPAPSGKTFRELYKERR